jgi:hypothetical protein
MVWLEATTLLRLHVEIESRRRAKHSGDMTR